MINKLVSKIQKTHAPIVVGLDPMMNYIPEHIQKKAFAEFGETLEGAAEAVWQYNKEIVDAVWDLIPAVKPQIAMYEQFGIPGTVSYTHLDVYKRQENVFFFAAAGHSLVFIKSVTTGGVREKIKFFQSFLPHIMKSRAEEFFAGAFSAAGGADGKERQFGGIGFSAAGEQFFVDTIDISEDPVSYTHLVWEARIISLC